MQGPKGRTHSLIGGLARAPRAAGVPKRATIDAPAAGPLLQYERHRATLPRQNKALFLDRLR